MLGNFLPSSQSEFTSLGNFFRDGSPPPEPPVAPVGIRVEVGTPHSIEGNKTRKSVAIKIRKSFIFNIQSVLTTREELLKWPPIYRNFIYCVYFIIIINLFYQIVMFYMNWTFVSDTVYSMKCEIIVFWSLYLFTTLNQIIQLIWGWW